jgi:hypothetical protein
MIPYDGTYISPIRRNHAQLPTSLLWYQPACRRGRNTTSWNELVWGMAFQRFQPTPASIPVQLSSVWNNEKHRDIWWYETETCKHLRARKRWHLQQEASLLWCASGQCLHLWFSEALVQNNSLNGSIVAGFVLFANEERRVCMHWTQQSCWDDAPTYLVVIPVM